MEIIFWILVAVAVGYFLFKRSRKRGGIAAVLLVVAFATPAAAGWKTGVSPPARDFTKLVGRAEAILPGQADSNRQPIELLIEEQDRVIAEDARSREEAIGDITARGGVVTGRRGEAKIALESSINEARDAFVTNNLVGGLFQDVVDAQNLIDMHGSLMTEHDRSGWYAKNEAELTEGFTRDEQYKIAETPNLIRARYIAGGIREEKRKVEQLSAGGASGAVAIFIATWLDVLHVAALFLLYIFMKYTCNTIRSRIHIIYNKLGNL